MKFFKIIFGRFAITGLLLLIQVIATLGLFWYLQDKFFYVYVVFYILSLLILLHIVSKDGNPSYKIPWIILILLSPVVGTILYILFGNRFLSRKDRKKYQSIKDKNNLFLVEENEALKEMEQQDKIVANQSKYIQQVSQTPIFSKTQTTYLPMGEVFFEKVLEQLKQAKHFIFLEFFILEEGKMWNDILDVLKEKIKEGVEVRVIYDDIGCINTLPHRYDRYLTSLGIQCIKFNKFKPIVSAVYNNRDHRKIIVIDGYIGFTGGINLADEYINEKKRFGHWKDTGIMLKGEAVRNLTIMFLTTFNIQSNTTDDYSIYMPQKEQIDGIARDGYVQPFGDGPAPVYKRYVGENVYMNMINSAKDYVYITTPYLIIDYNMQNALEAASLRGVDVRIITPHIPDKKMVFTLTRSYYRPLIQAGVKIYEYTPGFIHAKTLVCDDKIAIVGTINLDYRSFVHHFECGCFLYQTNTIQDIKKDFLETQALSEIPPKKVYKRGNIIKRIYIGLLQIFAPLM